MFKEERIYPRAKLTWPVSATNTSKGPLGGLTKDISIAGAYVCCRMPLRLNEVFPMVIDAPDRSLKVNAEVVWSNICGPDDEISPRGMGVRFLEISSEDRQVLAKAVLEHHQSNREEIDTRKSEALQTLIVDQEEIGPKSD